MIFSLLSYEKLKMWISLENTTSNMNDFIKLGFAVGTVTAASTLVYCWWRRRIESFNESQLESPTIASSEIEEEPSPVVVEICYPVAVESSSPVSVESSPPVSVESSPPVSVESSPVVVESSPPVAVPELSTTRSEAELPTARKHQLASR